MMRVRFFLVFVVMMAMAGTARASTISSVGSPNVTRGKIAVEGRVGFSVDETGSSQDERLRSRIHYDHGLTDHYAFRIILAGDDRKGNDFEADSIGIENRIHILKAEDHGFDFGLRLTYSHKDGDKKPDSIGARFYQRFPFDNWELRLNEFFNHQVGEDATGGISLTLRGQVTRKISDTHRLGVESFNSFGRLNNLTGANAQDHSFGPVLKGKIGNGVSYETGYRAGLTSGAPDHSFKFFLAKSF